MPWPPIPAHNPSTRWSPNTADSPLWRNNCLFWKTIPRRLCLSRNNSSPVLEPTSRSSGREWNFNNGHVCATLWHEACGPQSHGNAVQQTCVHWQSAHPEAAVAMWRANAAKAICASKQNYPFEAKSADRWRGRSAALAAALAAAAASAAASDTISLDSHS